MADHPCFSPENSRCLIAGFAFNKDFDCKVCLKTGYMPVIRSIVRRGNGSKLSAAGLAEKLSGSRHDGAAVSAPSICKYRGRLLQRGSCKCGDGAIWECLHPDMLLPDGNMAVGHRPGKQIGKACGEGKCKGYAAVTAGNAGAE